MHIFLNFFFLEKNRMWSGFFIKMHLWRIPAPNVKNKHVEFTHECVGNDYIIGKEKENSEKGFVSVYASGKQTHARN